MTNRVRIRIQDRILMRAHLTPQDQVQLREMDHREGIGLIKKRLQLDQI